MEEYKKLIDKLPNWAAERYNIAINDIRNNKDKVEGKDINDEHVIIPKHWMTFADMLKILDEIINNNSYENEEHTITIEDRRPIKIYGGTK